jgi:hypothetical protein
MNYLITNIGKSYGNLGGLPVQRQFTSKCDYFLW